MINDLVKPASRKCSSRSCANSRLNSNSYLPRALRDRLAPHVRVYTRGDLAVLFKDLPVQLVEQTVIFGAYDNLIARWPRLGRGLRGVLQGLERTPLRVFGLSHFWVVEKVSG